MKSPIALFYAREGVGGGSTSFTIHLFRGMQMAGIPATLYRIASKPKRATTLASYEGVPVTWLTPEEAVALPKQMPTLIVAAEHSKHLPDPTVLSRMIDAGARTVIHDPYEFMNRNEVIGKGIYDHLGDLSKIVRPICIRPTMKQFVKSAVFIPHPYVREFSGWQGADLRKRKAACSIARMTFVKRSDMIMEANERIADPVHRVQFHCMENRLFTKFKVMAKYPDFKQGGFNLPLEWGVSARHAKEYRLAVDFTLFPYDGGGSQYAEMEAWDAGTVPVMFHDWFRYPGEMVPDQNCLSVSSTDELADLVTRSMKSRALQDKLVAISQNATEHLEREHDPVGIAKKYHRELTK